MKKRIFAMLLALAMLLPAVFTACDPANPGEDGTGTSAESGTAAGTEGPGSEGKPPISDGPYNGFVLKASADDSYEISDNLFGIFLEDINHAVDGGLYAEQIYNRSFEFGDLAISGPKQGWTADKPADVSWDVIDGGADGSALNKNNTHYARVTNNSDDTRGIYNRGFYEDINVSKKSKYDFSVYARGVDGYSGKIYVSLESSGGVVYASGMIDSITGDWHKYSITIEPTESMTTGVRLVVRIDKGTVDLDMVSFMTQDTYEGSKNGKYGLRRDLAEMLEDLHPNFFRFPGGCIIEGMTLESAYNWKDSVGDGLEFTINGEKTIGDVATRPLCANIWADFNNKQSDAYYMTYGIGFYEYFLFCEDIGCEPIPVLNCGLSCQGRPNPSGPQPGTPEFQEYVQDALDLVEFCRGGTDTYWGGIRAAMGHPEPFHLTYIAIGNEQYGDEYNKRYAKFREAFNEAEKNDPELYGDLKLIMANGLTSGSRDGWDAVAKYGNDLADSLDEHYYNPPTWFLVNEQRYDLYDRNAPTAFIGEYASQSNLAVSAIAEAAYLTSVERNGDVVELATYAPLLAYDRHTQWAPNLVWYNSTNVWGSTNYYVQKIYADNQSARIIKSTLDGSDYEDKGTLSGRIGLGSWVTSAKFDDVVVTDTATGEVLFEEDFTTDNLSSYNVISGSFGIKDGALVQSNTAYPQNATTGDVIYMGSKTMSNYTMTFKATKIGGAEGFIIPFAVNNSKDFWHWNIGGWGNTVSTLEYVFPNGEGEYKTGQVPGTVKKFAVETNHEYEIKIVLDGYNIKGYIDGELMIDFDVPQVRAVYSVIGEDDDDIIVKLVNVDEKKSIPVKIDLSAISSYEGEAKIQYIKFLTPDTNNINGNQPIKIKDGTIEVSSVFEYELEKYSMVVIRIPKDK